MLNSVTRTRCVMPRCPAKDDQSWIKNHMQVDDALEHFLSTVSAKVKVRRSEVSRRVHYKCRRMRCGAPSVTRLSFSDADRQRFQELNDGFPIAASMEEISCFDGEIFSGDARVGMGDDHLPIGDARQTDEESRTDSKRKSRSKYLLEVSSLAKLVKLPRLSSPSRPRFLERLINSTSRSKQSSGETADLSAPAPDPQNDESRSQEGETNSIPPLTKEDGCGASRHDIAGLGGSETAPSGDGGSEDDPQSPPPSPIVTGLVKQRCESFKRLYEERSASSGTGRRLARRHSLPKRPAAAGGGKGGAGEKAVDREKPVTQEKLLVQEKSVIQEKSATPQKPVIQDKPVTPEKPVTQKKPVIQEKTIIPEKGLLQEKVVHQQKSNGPKTAGDNREKRFPQKGNCINPPKRAAPKRTPAGKKSNAEEKTKKCSAAEKEGSEAGAERSGVGPTRCRQTSFGRAVMERGYVRALAEQINTGHLQPLQDEEEESEPSKDAEAKDADAKDADAKDADAVCANPEEQEGRTPPTSGDGQCQCDQSGGSPKDGAPPAGVGDNRECSPAVEQNPDKPPSSHPSPKAKPPVDYAHKPKVGACSCGLSSKASSPSAKASGPSNKSPPSRECPKVLSGSAAKPCARTKPQSASDSSSNIKIAVDSVCERGSEANDSGVSESYSSSKSGSVSVCSAQHRETSASCVSNVESGVDERGEGDNMYDNVFFGQPRLSAQELFDASWSDSDSDFSFDSEDYAGPTQGVDVNESCGDKLYQVAHELLTTERTYVQRLSLLHQVFYFRLDQENRASAMFPADVLNQMFTSVQSLHQFHQDFLLRDLEERMACWGNQRRIGDLMKKNAPFLKLYTAYVKNFDNAMSLINTWLDKSPKFASIVQEIQKLPECGNLTLQHHMLGPIQRVPRYELLLKDYIKHLPEDSPDRTDAQDALNLVTTAASHSNEAMKKIEKFHQLLDIYQRLRGVALDFISPTRDFVREGPITKISARSGEKQSRYLFLFNDLLLICTDSLMGAYRVRAQLDIDGMEVKDGDNINIPNTFLVHSRQKAIELLEEPPNSQDTGWHELLLRVIADQRCRKGSLRSDLGPLHSPPSECPGKQAPRWIPDDAATMCMVCQLAFSAWRRRHHCRACGKLICKGCSKKAPLEYMNNRLERVCVACHDAIIYQTRSPLPSPDSSPTKKKGILQVKADDDAILAGYVQVSEDAGKTWTKRWLALHQDFVMYFFKARQDVSAFHSLPLPGYEVESVRNAEKSSVFRVHHRSINKKGILFQTDNQKLLNKWVGVLSKLVLAQLPDDSQRLSSQSNSSTASSGSDNTPHHHNNNNNHSCSSDKLSQADSGCPADSMESPSQASDGEEERGVTPGTDS